MTKEYKESMDAWTKHRNEIDEHNKKVFKQVGKTALKDLEEILEGCNITDKIQIVRMPSGEDQNEGCGIFTETYVDQWTMGISGDDFAGFIYVKFDENKWLQIPYEC